MKVSIDLAIFVSSLAHPSFRDKFISFHETPCWISLRYPETYTQFKSVRSLYSNQPWDESRAGGELTLQEKRDYLFPLRDYLKQWDNKEEWRDRLLEIYNE